ncbi:LacI family DNA-binding transcriptional regulator [Brachybacterium sp. YJGR34]|uniref:LacI family DNA-binding transcriptional regulator n=1 Tax=Brachybacterium sp. YJGR34 TaxID=2059911 RepID=UPI000E0AD568|nr:LacI family DNA-binding transcriptional regulator [Brachybacterium sp. YJGR34]
MAVTMADVARRAGVSPKTVSNVLNDRYPYIRPATRTRVLEAVEELGYRLNTSARALRTNRTGVIGLALPELRAPYFAELADEVFRAARDAGLRVVVEHVEPAPHVAVDHMAGAGAQGLDGALIAPASRADVALETAPPGFPIVVLGDRRLEGDVDQVFLANAQGARLAMEHLLGIGRTRIALLGADVHGTIGNAAERTAAYRAVLAEHGVPVADDLLLSTQGWTAADGAAALEDALAEGTRFDGLLALSDSLALGALSTLHRRRVAVPDEVAVVGFDGIDDSRFAVPPLTTVGVDRRRTARAAVELLLRRLDTGGADAPPAAVEIETELIVRGSTCPAS